MINLSFDELRLIAQTRNISGYENKPKEDLIKALSEPKSKSLKLEISKPEVVKPEILKPKIPKEETPKLKTLKIISTKLKNIKIKNTKTKTKTRNKS